MAVLASGDAGRRRGVLSLGEAKWGTVMGLRHLDRLRRARDLLTAKGFDTTGTVLTCYSAAGFDADLRAEATTGRDGIHLIGLDHLYSAQPPAGHLT